MSGVPLHFTTCGMCDSTAFLSYSCVCLGSFFCINGKKYIGNGCKVKCQPWLGGTGLNEWINLFMQERSNASCWGKVREEEGEKNVRRWHGFISHIWPAHGPLSDCYLGESNFLRGSTGDLVVSLCLLRTRTILSTLKQVGIFRERSEGHVRFLLVLLWFAVA